MPRTLTTISTLAIAPVLLIGATAASSPAAAPVAPPANVTVTIKAEGTDLSGQVKSTKPQRCAADRTVIVIRQRGARGGDDDERFAMDTTDEQDGKFVWSTGNTGTAGRFYAKVAKKPGCKKDTSPTIRATRN